MAKQLAKARYYDRKLCRQKTYNIWETSHFRKFCLNSYNNTCMY